MLPIHPPTPPRLTTFTVYFHESVQRYTYREWSREQNDEPSSNAAIELLSLGPLSDVSSTLVDNIPASKRPAVSDVLELTQKGRLHTTDEDITPEVLPCDVWVTNQCLFISLFLCARRLCKRAMRPLRAIYTRCVSWNASIGGLVWVFQFVGGWDTTLSEMSGAQDRLTNPTVAHMFTVSTQQPWHGREYGLCWLLACHSAGKLVYFAFHRPFISPN